MSDQQRDIPVPVVVAAAFALMIGVTWLSGAFGEPKEPETVAASSPSQAPAFQRSAPAAEPSEPQRRYVLDAFESQYQAEEAMRVVLKDPASAVFDDVWLIKVVRDGQNSFGFCGSVNARNSFGGYGDAERFVALPLGAALESQGEAFAAPNQLFCVEGERIHQVNFRTR